MLNKRPIFIVAFAYGGSNILLNLLRTHPDVCSPRGELNEVFKGKLDEPLTTRAAKFLRYLPCALVERRDIFRFNSWGPRPPMTPFTRRRIDRILYDEKFRARDASQNLYKYEGVRYTREEIAQSRLLCKNLDGLTYLSEHLARMYPDATFFGLTRNGLAVCEGHLRRGYNLETIARNYERGCQQMIADAQRIPNYHIIKYEEIIAKPLEMLKTIYQLAGLDLSLVRKVRLETKPIVQQDGTRAYIHNTDAKQLRWYDLTEFPKHFRPDANANQIKRLTDEQRRTILRACERSLRHFGYI